MTTPLIDYLRCPFSGEKLRKLTREQVAEINRIIDSGEARDHVDQPVGEQIEDGFWCAESKRLFPVRDSIPSLIPDESIVVSGSEFSSSESSGDEFDG